MDKKTIICLMGPTASGKSAVALRLAEQCPIEIVSVDASLVYRGMDIGTAKPSRAERACVPHHGIDLVFPHEIFSVGEFIAYVKKIVPEIITRGKTPLFVGGTMMYFNRLQKGLVENAPRDPLFRKSIEEKAVLFGWKKMHALLAQKNPARAEKIHPNDAKRITRALEVLEQPQSSSTSAEIGFFENYSVQYFALISPRDIFRDRIEARFDAMLQAGFQAEVEQLFQDPNIHMDLPAVRSLGYTEMYRYLQGEYDFKTMREKTIIATKQFAKRQLTWLRSWENLQISPDEEEMYQQLFKVFNK